MPFSAKSGRNGVPEIKVDLFVQQLNCLNIAGFPAPIHTFARGGLNPIILLTYWRCGTKVDIMRTVFMQFMSS